MSSFRSAYTPVAKIGNAFHSPHQFDMWSRDPCTNIYSFEGNNDQNVDLYLHSARSRWHLPGDVLTFC
jgi:hypothetical protein